MHGMVAREGKLCFDLDMAFFAHILHLFLADRQVRTHMDIMAVKAGDIALCVGTGIPVVHIEMGTGGMALQANERLSRGREVLQVDKGIMPAGSLLAGFCVLGNLLRRNVLDCEASWAVARFAVDQRHP